MTYRDGCKANCAYCGLARKRKGSFDEKSFIRVDWPIYPFKEILQRTKEREYRLKRICLSMVTHPKAVNDLIVMTKEAAEVLSLPISVLITPTLIKKEHLRILKDFGADMVGVAIDTATPELFNKLRGRVTSSPHRWDVYWKGLKEAVEIFGEGKVGCHFIVGLGESEKEMVFAIQKAHDLGARTHLFSFFPEEGSMIEDWPQPPLDQYRRVQLARHLIDEGISRYERMEFDEVGRAVHFGIDGEELNKVIESGKAFMTSGCPAKDGSLACNRPFSNERPSQPIRNFPFKPSKEDVDEIKRQICL